MDSAPIIGGVMHLFVIVVVACQVYIGTGECPTAFTSHVEFWRDGRHYDRFQNYMRDRCLESLADNTSFSPSTQHISLSVFQSGPPGYAYNSTADLVSTSENNTESGDSEPESGSGSGDSESDSDDVMPDTSWAPFTTLGASLADTTWQSLPNVHDNNAQATQDRHVMTRAHPTRAALAFTQGTMAPTTRGSGLPGLQRNTDVICRPGVPNCGPGGVTVSNHTLGSDTSTTPQVYLVWILGLLLGLSLISYVTLPCCTCKI
ncbi:glycoprotein 350 [Colobine gammaherpesvirus 1]|uniref:Glycoprotein 350 n=1 Tax=Colobine gammaherpesvirus 1 TaxID=2597325 RepID=A0A5B8G902_9GAMA|nr:glycoprotein 350 [Colobine gammaherpesvirus 1]QDQ69258.1 glycoprotein 350 [Colobine gammaherpesvirus 1]